MLRLCISLSSWLRQIQLGDSFRGDDLTGMGVAVGANSVVTTSFPDSVTVLESPARIVKKYA